MIVVDDVKVGKNQGGKADKFMTENFTLMESGKFRFGVPSDSDPGGATRLEWERSS